MANATNTSDPVAVTQGGTGLASTTANEVLYSSATSVIGGITTANNAVLNTNGSGVPSMTATPTIGGLITATTGISFGDETLANYDEGTFTPTATFSTAGDLSVGYTTQLGSYTRIGNMVLGGVVLHFTPTFTTSSGDFLIQAAPFTCGAEPGNLISPAYETLGNLTFPAGTTYLTVGPNPSTTNFVIPAAGSATARVLLQASDFVSTTAYRFKFTFAYFI